VTARFRSQDVVLDAPPYRGKPLATLEHLDGMARNPLCTLVSKTYDLVVLRYSINGEVDTWQRVKGGSDWFELVKVEKGARDAAA
jgi:hypothetical protein